MARVLASALLLQHSQAHGEPATLRRTVYVDDVFDCGSLQYDTWSENMKVWCCHHKGIGCHWHTENYVSYDCQNDLSDWERGWSRTKKAWCCSHENKACQPFDCEAGWSNWHTKWTIDKRKYCCRTTHRGCPHAPTHMPTTVAFDCAAGYTRWEKGWSPQKKAWCCEHEHKACQRYDCLSGLQDWHNLWNASKHQWCCDHEADALAISLAKVIAKLTTGNGADEPGIAKAKAALCPGASTTTVAPLMFNCSAGYDRWETGWTRMKKEWCCANEHKACNPYDCREGYDHWQTNWTDEKRTWCCKDPDSHFCPSAKAYDCIAGYQTWKTGWSDAKKEWCCQKESKGCTGSYDCAAGFDRWKTGWSAAKMDWCCQKENKGCTVFYNCDEGYDTWQTSWARGKKDWCCKVRDCSTATTTIAWTTTTTLFDCAAGYAQWETGWSPAKKEWCCSHHQIGCRTSATFTSTTTTTQFDCAAGYAKWETGWSPAKKDWCCLHHQVGCPPTTTWTLTTTTTPFDCSAGYANWRKGWSDSKKEWCCLNENKGCHVTPFDCDFGFSWLPGFVPIIGWTIEKGEWCCKHEEKGCVPEATNVAYDCSAGDRHSWSDDQRTWCCASKNVCDYNCDTPVSTWTEENAVWCCEHQGKGCTTITTTSGVPSTSTTTATTTSEVPASFNCSSGLGRLNGWSVAKKAWCCAHENLGCEPFDCYAGQSNWERGWSTTKKDYCCTHEPHISCDGGQSFFFTGPHLNHLSTNILLGSLLILAFLVPLIAYLIKSSQQQQPGTSYRPPARQPAGYSTTNFLPSPPDSCGVVRRPPF